MADKCKFIVQLLDIFQSRRPITTKIFHYREHLQMKFAASKQLQDEACAEHFKGLDVSFAIKTHILNIMEQAYNNAEEKLTKYMSDGQPAINLLQEVRVFDPHHTPFMNDSASIYKDIPGFGDVSNDEFDACFNHLGPAALRASVCGVVDLDVFWDGLQERYKDIIVNSADAERSNSIYKLVFSKRKRSITNNNLKALVFLYHNQQLTSGAFEMDEMEKACEEDSEEDMEDI